MTASHFPTIPSYDIFSEQGDMQKRGTKRHGVTTSQKE